MYTRVNIIFKKILESAASLGNGVKEGVEVEGDVSEEKGWARVCVWGDALEQRQGVAHPVRLVGGQGRRVDRWIDVDDFLN